MSETTRYGVEMFNLSLYSYPQGINVTVSWGRR